MFNKDLFKQRLEFYIRQWLGSSDILLTEFGQENAEIIMSHFHTASMILLWQLKDGQTVMYGIDNEKAMGEFCNMITMAVNQLKEQIVHLEETRVPKPFFLIKLNFNIKETVEDLADEIEQLIKLEYHASK